MKKGIIVASFGTTHEKTRKLCIESIEKRIKKEYKNFLVLRAFTSQVIIKKLKTRDDYLVDGLTEALEKMKYKQVYDIHIQPLHILPGKEYEKIINQANEFSKENSNIRVQIGRPLIFDDLDYDEVVEGLSFIKRDPEEAVVFMGHGCDLLTDMSYEELENRFREKSYKNIFIGTLKGRKTIDHIIPILKSQNIKKVKLMPFMLVAGRHALYDMISGENSWQGKLLSEGIQVQTSLKGLGQIKSIQDIYISHLRNIMTSEKIKSLV